MKTNRDEKEELKRQFIDFAQQKKKLKCKNWIGRKKRRKKTTIDK